MKVHWAAYKSIDGHDLIRDYERDKFYMLMPGHHSFVMTLDDNTLVFNLDENYRSSNVFFTFEVYDEKIYPIANVQDTKYYLCYKELVIAMSEQMDNDTLFLVPTNPDPSYVYSYKLSTNDVILEISSRGGYDSLIESSSDGSEIFFLSC